MSEITSLSNLLMHIDDAEWVRAGVCSDLPVEAIEGFFVPAGGKLDPAYERMCADCPVRAECVAHAVDAGITAGYFGGVSPTRRKSLAGAHA